jgi:hypothetical protein
LSGYNIKPDLIQKAKFPANPDWWNVQPDYESENNLGDNYGGRMSAFFKAPKSGNYTFYVAGDDAHELWKANGAFSSSAATSVGITNDPLASSSRGMLDATLNSTTLGDLSRVAFSQIHSGYNFHKYATQKSDTMYLSKVWLFFYLLGFILVCRGSCTIWKGCGKSKEGAIISELAFRFTPFPLSCCMLTIKHHCKYRDLFLAHLRLMWMALSRRFKK